MKIKTAVSLHPAPSEIIAKFGPVHLIRLADGRHTLTHGTPAARAKARTWCVRHTPFVVFNNPAKLALAQAARRRPRPRDPATVSAAARRGIEK